MSFINAGSYKQLQNQTRIKVYINNNFRRVRGSACKSAMLTLSFLLAKLLPKTISERFDCDSAIWKILLLKKLILNMLVHM